MKSFIFSTFLVTFAKAFLVSRPNALNENFTIEAPSFNQGNNVSADSTNTSHDNPKQYIVVYKRGHRNGEYDAHDEWINTQFSSLKKRGKMDSLPDGIDDGISAYTISSFKGYVAYLPPTLLDAVQEDPLVAFVEEDSLFQISSLSSQAAAPWGLARVSHNTTSNRTSSKYIYESEGGKGVTAYVIDSGIEVEHYEFEGRATWGESISASQTEIDDIGHGSHVAGIIGGKTFGVAKNVNLVALKVCDSNGKGRLSHIIKAIQLAVSDHQAKVASKGEGYKGAVINISLGGTISKALDYATNAAVNAGIHVIAAAGNDNQNACKVSPARATGVITVGSIDSKDKKAKSSNWGECVDINAPGVKILSVGINNDTKLDSGTSMATPHVTGLIAYFLSLRPESKPESLNQTFVAPADLKKRLIKFGIRNAISRLKGDTPNVLAYNGASGNLSDFWII